MTHESSLDIDLDLLLPEAPDARDACVGRLLATLEGRPGVIRAHVDLGAARPRLCVHHDPSVYPTARLRQAVVAAGAALTDRYGHVFVDGLHPRQARGLVEGAERIPGVLAAHPTAVEGLAVEFDRERTSKEALRDALAELTGSAAPAPAPGHEHEGDEPGQGHVHGGAGERNELYAAIATGVLVGGGWIAEAVGAPSNLVWALYGLAYVTGGAFTLRDALLSLRARRLEIDTLMLVAAVGAAILGELFEGALLLFLFGIGHALESYAMGRARRAVEALGKLAPRTATVLVGELEEQVKVEALAIGDTVLVRPNERVAADGYVMKGTSAVDEAAITGESIPVDKRPVDDPAAVPPEVPAAHRLFAGTLNGAGPLVMIVTRRASDTTLARVVHMVTEADTGRARTQQLTDRFERVFVPVVLLLAVGVVAVGVALGQPFPDAFYRSMAVLVAASPCALAIATPSAVLSAVARAARGGVLVKGGAALESLGSVEAFAFDKTGTLTQGRPELTDVVALNGGEDALLAIAAALEARSDHPLAAAVVRGTGAAREAADDVRSVTGKGITGVVRGLPTSVGKLAWMQELGRVPEAVSRAVDDLSMRGRTTIVVRHGDQHLGVLGLMDLARPDATEAVRQLRAAGAKRLILLSGDDPRVAAAIAKELGLDEARGGLMPGDKVTALRELRAAHGPVAMVGDGVNDGPALASADVGIAMGAAGSDVALETADVALMADDLAKLPLAVALGRRTASIIRQNLVLSLGMVAILIPATLTGYTGIGPAVALHEGSTVLVVANALRLLAWRYPVATNPPAASSPAAEEERKVSPIAR